MRRKDILFRIAFSLFSQGLLGIMSILTSLVLPQKLGPEQYGYYQSFMFYVGYLNLLGLGFNDGITLHYAGKCKEEIQITAIRTAIRIQILICVLFTALIFAFSVIIFSPPKLWIILAVGCNLIPTVIFCTCNGIFLAENRSYLYNLSNLLQRTPFCLILIGLLLGGYYRASYVILAYTLVCSLIIPFMLIKARTYIFGKGDTWRTGARTFRTLCVSGMAITISVCAGGLIPTFGRVVIEIYESAYTYGVYSFYVGLLSIVFAFTNTVGIVAFPIMRNSNQGILPSMYKKTEKIYALLGMFMFLFYPLGELLIERFMPKYAEGLLYFPLIFSICYPLGKIQMLISPYYKTLRLEKRLSIINIVSLCITAALTMGFCAIWQTPRAVAAGTMIGSMIYYMILSNMLHRKGNTDFLVRILDWTTPVAFLLGIQFLDRGTFIKYYAVYIVAVIILTTAINRRTHNYSFGGERCGINEEGKEKPMGNCLWIGSYADSETRNTLLKYATSGLSTAINVQKRLLDGMEYQGCYFDTLNVYPLCRSCKKWVLRYNLTSRNPSVSDTAIPFINLPFLHHPDKLRHLIHEARAWGRKVHGHNVVVYALSSINLLCAWYMKKAFGVHTVVIVPDLPEYMSNNQSVLYRSLKLLDRVLINFCLRRMDAFVLFSEKMLERLPIKGKSYTVMEGILNFQEEEYLKKVQLRKKHGQKVVMLSGNLSKEDGIGTLLEAFSRIPGEEYQLWFTGTGDMEEEIQKACQKDPRIRFLGFIESYEDFLNLQVQAKVFALMVPIEHPKSPYYFPSKVMEYLNAGGATVCYPLPCFPAEYLPHLHFFKAGDEAATLKALLDLDPQTIQEEAMARIPLLKSKHENQQSKKIIQLLKIPHSEVSI